MSILQRDTIAIAAIFLSLAGAYLAYDYLPERIPVHWDIYGHINVEINKRVGIYLYPGAMAAVYIFFRLIPYADKNRVRQLKEIGLYDPLRNGAVLFFAYSHILALGIGLGLISWRANLLAGILSLAALLAGNHLKITRPNLFLRLLNLLKLSTDEAAQDFICHSLILSGALGLIGTATGILQFAWLLLPLALCYALAQRRYPHNPEPNA